MQLQQLPILFLNFSAPLLLPLTVYFRGAPSLVIGIICISCLILLITQEKLKESPQPLKNIIPSQLQNSSTPSLRAPDLPTEAHSAQVGGGEAIQDKILCEQSSLFVSTGLLRRYAPRNDGGIKILQSALPFIIFCLWAISASFWSPKITSGLTTSIKLFSVLLIVTIVFTALERDYLKNMLNAMYGGLLITIFLLALEMISHSLLKTSMGNPRYDSAYGHVVTMISLVTWPIIAFKYKSNPILAIIIIPITMVLLLLTYQHATKIAFAIAIGVFLASLINPRFFLRLGAIASVIIVLAFPFLIKAIDPKQIVQQSHKLLLKSSYDHRLFILKRTSNGIFERPILGHGLNSFVKTIDIEKMENQPIGQMIENISKGKDIAVDLDILGQAMHPHNLSMQIWYELGGIGAVIFAAFLFIGLWRISNLSLPRVYLSSFAAFYTSAFIIAHLSYGVWQTWWLFTLAFLFTIVIKQLSQANDDVKMESIQEKPHLYVIS